MPDWSWWSFVVGGLAGIGLAWLLILAEQLRHQQEDEERRRG